MPKWQVDIKIKKRFKAYVNRMRLKNLIHAALISEKAASPAEVSLLVTDDEDVHRLNKRYRGTDRTTDVLAFALQEDKPVLPSGENSGHTFILPQDGIYRLGEVVISYPQAERQAGENHNTVEDEIDTLAVHGLLHLLGCDDANPRKRARMRLRQERILRNFRTELYGKFQSSQSGGVSDIKEAAGESGNNEQLTFQNTPETDTDSSRGQGLPRVQQ